MMEKLLGLLMSMLAGHAAAQQCTMVGKYENNSVSVFKTSDGLITFKSNVDVNTDGALQSYKIDDLGFLQGNRIQTNSALNTICNGVNIRRPNHSKLFGAGQCTALIAEFKRIRNFGWLKNGENYVEFYAIALVPGTQTPQGENRGKPCEKDGFYVSQVAKAMDASKPVCDPDHWVDALRIPAIVLPLDQRMKDAGANLHDLVIIRLANGKRVGAIVGDTNPRKIGEATVIANMRLKGLTTTPANYLATVGLAIPSAQYVIFPGTKNLITNLSNASDGDIQAKTQQLFDQFNLGQRQQLCP
jgi:hypothetical protein